MRTPSKPEPEPLKSGRKAVKRPFDQGVIVSPVRCLSPSGHDPKTVNQRQEDRPKDWMRSHRRLDVYDFLVEQAKELQQQPQIRPPLLKGDDLMALGMKPGPGMGALLAEIREKQLEDELRTRDEAEAWARTRITGK